VFSDSETVYAARHESPLVLGIGDDGHYLASDVPAFIEYTDRVVYLDDGQFARINPAGIIVTDAQGAIVETAIETVAWDPEDAGKSGYDHYMLKEIHEQPRAIRQCLRQRVTESRWGRDDRGIGIPRLRRAGTVRRVWNLVSRCLLRRTTAARGGTCRLSVFSPASTTQPRYQCPTGRSSWV